MFLAIAKIEHVILQTFLLKIVAQLSRDFCWCSCGSCDRDAWGFDTFRVAICGKQKKREMMLFLLLVIFPQGIGNINKELRFYNLSIYQIFFHGIPCQGYNNACVKILKQISKKCGPSVAHA